MAEYHHARALGSSRGRDLKRLGPGLLQDEQGGQLDDAGFFVLGLGLEQAVGRVLGLRHLPHVQLRVGHPAQPVDGLRILVDATLPDLHRLLGISVGAVGPAEFAQAGQPVRADRERMVEGLDGALGLPVLEQGDAQLVVGEGHQKARFRLLA